MNITLAAALPTRMVLATPIHKPHNTLHGGGAHVGRLLFPSLLAVIASTAGEKGALLCLLALYPGAT